jgi:predicted DNA-binding transcriptional regulator YafY
MYQPTTRVLTVLELLQSHGSMSGRELSERLEVDIRTVRRYITMLQDLGIPVEAERGRYGTYRLMPGFKLPPLMFTEDEALALTLGMLVTRRLGLPVTALATESALAKIERVMPRTLQDRVQAVQDALIIDLSSSSAIPQSTTVITLSKAVQQRQRVWFSYQSWQAEDSERDFDPYGVVYYGGYWYTVGYCHLRQALRTFRLDRIAKIDLCDEHFTRPPADFDALQYVINSIARTPGTYRVEVLFQTTLEEAKQQLSPTLGTLEETTDGILLCCNVQHLGWLAHTLAGLPFPMIIREPDQLRQTFRKFAAKLERIADAMSFSEQA